MSHVRRSLLYSLGDRYFTQVFGIATMAIMARILTPAETGQFLVASGVLLLAEAFRDFGMATYLVQKRELTHVAVRTAFTVTLVLSLAMAMVMYLSTRAIAGYFGDENLSSLLLIGTVGFALVPFGTPALALLRRDMQFRTLAGMNIAAALTTAVITIVLALRGNGPASYVWGSISGNAVATGLAVVMRPHAWMYRPCLREWRQVLSFGLISSAVMLANMTFDMLPRFALGRFLGFDAVGLYMRALSLCQLPDRAIVSALQPVVLPALAARYRAHGDLKQAYLRGLTLMSAVQWPALLTLALLAHPVVELLLGDQWLAAAPLTRILAVGTMALAPAFMTHPVLVAVGRVRDTLFATLISLPPSILLVVGAAPFGLEAVAFSLLLTAPLQMAVALYFIRRAIGLEWREVRQAYAATAVVAFGTAFVPACVLMLAPGGLEIGLPWAALAGCGAMGGWLVAIYLSGHPLLLEVRQVYDMLKSAVSPTAQRAVLSPR